MKDVSIFEKRKKDVSTFTCDYRLPVAIALLTRLFLSLSLSCNKIKKEEKKCCS